MKKSIILFLSTVLSIFNCVYSQNSQKFDLSSSSIIYFENFSSDPNYYINVLPSGNEYYQWDLIENMYKIRLEETSNIINKFVLSPQFNKVENKSFQFRIDLKPVEVSYAMGIGLRFYDTDISFSKYLIIHHGGSDSPYFIFDDYNGHVYLSKIFRYIRKRKQ